MCPLRPLTSSRKTNFARIDRPDSCCMNSTRRLSGVYQGVLISSGITSARKDSRWHRPPLSDLLKKHPGFMSKSHTHVCSGCMFGAGWDGSRKVWTVPWVLSESEGHECHWSYALFLRIFRRIAKPKKPAANKANELGSGTAMAAVGCGLSMFETWQIILVAGSLSVVRVMGWHSVGAEPCCWVGEAGRSVAIKPACAADDMARMHTLENNRKWSFMNGWTSGNHVWNGSLRRFNRNLQDTRIGCSSTCMRETGQII